MPGINLLTGRGFAMENEDERRPELYMVCPKCNLRLVRAQFCAFDGAQLEKFDQSVWQEKEKSVSSSNRCTVNVRTWDMSDKSIYCPQCDQGWSKKLTFCPDDGKQLGGGMRKNCPACERVFAGNLVVCPHDGTLLLPNRNGFVEKYCGAVLQTQQHQYEVVETIAAKGDSLLLRAMEKGESDRPVALKVLATLFSDPQYMRKAQRFVRQVEAYKNLVHPNIVRLLHHGQTFDGRPYLVFELVTGGVSLDLLMGQFGKLPMQYFVDVCSGVCAALQFAHEQGVFHYDLSPNDVLVEGTANDGIRVRMTDFSKGEPLIHGDNKWQQMTEVGDLFGHPEYMSPEACYGQPIDARSNVFSLGCIMYAMLSPVNPFEGAHWGAVLLKKLHEKPEKLPTISVQPELTKPLEAIIIKCMEQKPEDRFQSMAQLNEALQALPLNAGAEPVAYSKLSQLIQKKAHAYNLASWPAL